MRPPRAPEIEAALTAHLRAATAGRIRAAGDLAWFGDGHSGFTYSVELDEAGARRRAVLRLSPPGARLRGPADIGRQGRIVGSLAGSAVPVPEVIACASEPAVADRAYMLIELVPGVSWEAVCEAGGGDADALAAAAVGCLRELHSLAPYVDLGEAPLSPREEARRWLPLLERAPSRVRAGGELLLAALEELPPSAVGPRRIHGDYHFGNLLFGPDHAVVAVLDWEISSLGHPLADLGTMVVGALRRARYPEEPNSMGDVPVAPRRLIELYGAGEEEAAWFAACACLKYAAIIGYNYELHRRGKREDPEYARLVGTMQGLPRDGLEILEHGVRAAER